MRVHIPRMFCKWFKASNGASLKLRCESSMEHRARCRRNLFRLKVDAEGGGLSHVLNPVNPPCRTRSTRLNNSRTSAISSCHFGDLRNFLLGPIPTPHQLGSYTTTLVHQWALHKLHNCVCPIKVQMLWNEYGRRLLSRGLIITSQFGLKRYNHTAGGGVTERGLWTSMNRIIWCKEVRAFSQLPLLPNTQWSSLSSLNYVGTKRSETVTLQFRWMQAWTAHMCDLSRHFRFPANKSRSIYLTEIVLSFGMSLRSASQPSETY